MASSLGGESIHKANFSLQTPVVQSCNDANFVDKSVPVYQPEKHYLHNIPAILLCTFVCLS